MKDDVRVSEKMTDLIKYAINTYNGQVSANNYPVDNYANAWYHSNNIT